MGLLCWICWLDLVFLLVVVDFLLVCLVVGLVVGLLVVFLFRLLGLGLL